MIYHVKALGIRIIFFPLVIILLAGAVRSVFAVDRVSASQLDSPVPFYHTYNLTSLYPVGKQDSPGSRDTGSQRSLTMEDCIEMALEKNPDHNISRQALRATTGDLFAAWGLYAPNVFAGFGLSQSNLSHLFTSTTGISTRMSTISKASSGSFGISFILFNQAEKYFGLKNAYYLRGSRRSKLQGSELIVVNDVRAAYFNVLRQEKLLEAAREQAEQLSEQLRRAEKRFSLGEVTKLDVLQAQIDLQNQELLILEYENLLVTAKMDLDQVAGGGLGIDFSLADEFEIREYRFDIEELVTEALEKHPELESLLLEIKLQRGNLWIGRLAYLPTLTTTLGYARNEEGLTFTPNTGRNRSVTFTAKWNIFQGFLRFQQNRYAQVTVDSLKYESIKTRLTIARNVRESYLELLRLSERNITLAESKRMAAESLRLERRRYELGSSSMVELRIAQADYLQAEVDFINSIYDYHEALSTLSLNVGRDVSLDYR